MSKKWWLFFVLITGLTVLYDFGNAAVSKSAGNSGKIMSDSTKYEYFYFFESNPIGQRLYVSKDGGDYFAAEYDILRR
jgi:hypothetical protein